MALLHHCRGPIWRLDDLSLCFQHNFLQTIIPLVAVVCSVSLLLIQILSSPHKHTQEDYGIIDDTGVYNQPDSPLSATDSVLDGSIDSENDLRPIKSNAAHSTFTIDKPRGYITIPFVEELAVLSDLGIQIAGLATHAWGPHGSTAAAASIIIWSYITALTTLRLLYSKTPKVTISYLWYHTAALYFIEWICGVMLFRSQLIHPTSPSGRNLAIGHFVIVNVLFAISLASRRGNSTVELEFEDGIRPSKEATASIFALATFSWLDPLIWQGYKRPLDISDVWNLLPKDKAAKILADYRQIKKTSSLAVHLLGFFKKDLILQAFFAALDGLNTFIPTLLLKALLEYVEDPGDTPVSAAWLYVILFFVSGCFSGLASGQALWYGRKIGIRLRAVIIGEVYAKALRRRAAASIESKTLGNDREQDSPPQKKATLSKRVSQFFKRKSKASLKTSEPRAKQTKTDDAQVSSGAIINLMAVDSFKVAEVCSYLHFLWADTPIQLITAIVLLYKVLGYSSIAGLGMMVVLTPVNLFIARQFATIQKKILGATDARIHTTNEVLQNIRIIKYFAWEHRFSTKVEEKRAVELAYLRRRFLVWAFAATTWTGAPVVIALLSFAVFTLVEKRPLVPSVAFTAISLFSILRVPLDQLADMVAHVQEARVSVDRVEEYLNEAETSKYEQLTDNLLDRDGEPVIGFDECTFSWGSEDTDDFKLMDVNLNFKVGQINIIAGPTGSGKTSMLMALLGEMSLLAGSVHLPGARSRESLRADPATGLTESVAYCAQQAWLINGTIKDNIVFASPFDARRYNDVIVACSLQRDLEILDNGDQTLVGEKGVTLSGGQKQRISLARALYSRARHLLLDDVLSAVDTHTAKWIFDKAIAGPLMRHRTCILVTHNVALCVPRADFTVVLENGRIVAQGEPSTVIESGMLSEDLTKSILDSKGPSRLPSRCPSNVGFDAVETGPGTQQVANGDVAGETEVRDGADIVRVISNKAIPGVGPDVTATLPDEARSTGSVNLRIILMYLRSMGGWAYWLTAVLAFLCMQLTQVATNLWVRQWANAYDDRREYGSFSITSDNSLAHQSRNVWNTAYLCPRGSCVWPIFPGTTQKGAIGAQTYRTDVSNGVDDKYYLGIYALIGLLYCASTFTRVGWVFVGGLSASNQLHRRLIDSVLRAKFRFFDSTPLGQIMNRFSKDIELIDQEIAPVSDGVIHCLASMVTIIVLISVIVPQFLIAALFISLTYYVIGRIYIDASRDLKRLESISRSPLYQQFGETLSGMTTIRAYGDERRFIRDNLNKINTHSRPFIYLWAANRWLALRVDITGALVSFFTGVFIILSVGRIDAGAAGLAMTYAVTFTENVLWFVRLYAENEQNMNAVERVKEYFDVDQEAPAILDENRPPANWPSHGGVEVIGYSTRYRTEFDYVLKNITFKVLPGEKVGVVGRTGAGKSSLALALFRALEAEEGKVLIDGVDIGLIGLQDLRENIVMVPQDPTLFTGTVRNNLDPFDLYTDEEIFDALRRVQLIGGSAESTRPSTPVNGTVQNKKSSHSLVPNSKYLTVNSSSAPSDATTATVENKNIFKNLSSSIAESGSNLSQGQRQLLCLARALLKAPKVLLMDEATASIDYATDAKIQETIREFKNTTLTIAHRLQTIIDYDKVLVLDRGEVVEFGSPHELLSKAEGSFKAMCETSGDIESLRKEAKKASDAKKLVDDE